MEEKEILQQAAKAITQDAFTFEVDVPAKNRAHGWLQKVGLRPKKRVFAIRPLTLGTCVRISRILLRVDLKSISQESSLYGAHEVISKSGKRVSQIIALAITNTKELPAKELISFLHYHLTPSERMKLLSVVMEKMDVQNFIFSIVVLRGLNVLEKNTSPAEPQ